MGAPIHGQNALIYVDGNEIVGGNAWSLDVGTATVDTPQFGDTWVKRVVGMNDWSGSISAWDQTDESILFTAATGGAAVTLLIYPNSADTATYYTGSAIFGHSADGSTSSAVSANGSFVGNDTLTATGFS